MSASTSQSSGNTAFLPFGQVQGGPSAGVNPQGFDFGQLAHQIAGQAAQALPGLIMGLLSSNPVIAPQMRAQSASPQGVSPQGFDFGQLAKNIAGQAAHALPGLIMGLLSAHPSVGPQIQAQSTAAGVAPQSLINLGFQSPFGGGGFSLFGAMPQAGVAPQGFDFGQLAQQIAGQAAQALPGLIMGLLSAHPSVGPQIRAQSAAAGVAPQSLINLGFQSPFGGGGFSLFDATPQAGVAPQGFDLGQFAQQIASQAAQALPGLIMGLLSANPQLAPRQNAPASSATH